MYHSKSNLSPFILDSDVIKLLNCQLICVSIIYITAFLQFAESCACFMLIGNCTFLCQTGVFISR